VSLIDFYSLPMRSQDLTECSACGSAVAVASQQRHRDSHLKLADYLVKRDKMLDDLMDLVVRHNAMQPHISVTGKNI
jgi:hypothetical protein